MPRQSHIPSTFVLTEEGIIQKRGSKWYPRLDGYDSATGKRLRPSLGGYDSAKAAKNARRDAITALQRGTRLDRSITVADYLNGYIDDRSLEIGDNTLATYTIQFRCHVIPRMGALPLQAVDSKALRRLYKDVAERGPSVPGKVHEALHKALADAVPTYLPYNPAHGCAPKEPRPDTAAWTEDELNVFLEAAVADPCFAAFVVMSAVGARRNELLGIEWRDVDLDAETAMLGRVTRDEFWQMYAEPDENGQRGHTVVKDKRGGKNDLALATVHLPPVAIDALHYQRTLQSRLQLACPPGAWERTDRVFTDEIGRALKPTRVTKAFRRIADGQPVPHLTLYGLRHTFATLGLDKGVEDHYMKVLMRHSSTAMLTRYQHARPAKLADRVDELTAGIRLGKRPAPTKRAHG